MSLQGIVDAAYELFSKDCYENVSLTSIAEKVGIKKPSIYAHFSSKEELYLTVLDSEIKRVCDYIEQAYVNTGTYSSEDLLYELLIKCVTYTSESEIHKGFWRNILFCPTVALQEQISQRKYILSKKVQDIAARVISRGIEKREIKEQSINNLMYAFSCLLMGNFVMMLNTDVFSIEQLDFSWRIYWNGVKGSYNLGKGELL